MRGAAVVCPALIVAGCVTASPASQITRDRAVAIARAQVRWEPFEVTAARRVTGGRQVWRVTLKGRLPDQPPMLYETAVIELDASTGAIVSASKT